MKIALLVPSWPPGFSPNGIVTYASQLVPALRRLGHEVFVLTTPRDYTDPYTVNVREFAQTPTVWDRAAHKLMPDYAVYRAGCALITSAVKHIVAQHHVDVLEIEESFGWSLAISRLNLLPVVVRLHGPWFLNGRFEGRGRALDTSRQVREGKGIRNAHFVTSPSAEVLRSVQDRYGCSLAASWVIPNPLEAGVEPDMWGLATCNRNTLLFVGRSDARKGGDLVLRTFATLAPSYPGLRLTFVGPDLGITGPDGRTWSLEKFFRSVVPERYRSQVEFRGQMDHSDVATLRSGNFATIVASRYEIMPYSVLEAMSLGCPIVATAVGGIPELIKDQHNGLLVPSDDVSAMSEACRKLLDDHALAARLGRQAWQDCRDLYSPASIAQQTIAAYHEAIDAFRLRSKARSYFSMSQ